MAAAMSSTNVNIASFRRLKSSKSSNSPHANLNPPEQSLPISIIHALIFNIPPFYHSATLRNFFSQFIEAGGFDCFHFRHRPEIVRPLTSGNGVSLKSGLTESAESVKGGADKEKKKRGSTCCIVRLKEERLTELMRLYRGKRWLDERGEPISAVCRVSKIRIVDQSGLPQPAGRFQTRAESRQIPADRETFAAQDLATLPELNPPALMPNGNVGTPTVCFLRLVQLCKLPPSIISKLGLVFPRMRSNRRYGTVPLDYGTPRCHRNEKNAEGEENESDSENSDEDQSIGERKVLAGADVENLPESKWDQETEPVICKSDDQGISSIPTQEFVELDGKSLILNAGKESSTCDGRTKTSSSDIKHCGDVHSQVSIQVLADHSSSVHPQALIYASEFRESLSATGEKKSSHGQFNRSQTDQEQSGRSSIGLRARARVIRRPPHDVKANKSEQKVKRATEREERGRNDEGSDSDDCEEWDRYTALHDDPTNQERGKERLFEEDMEVVWEKGGSGLVWYTDAQFWDQQDGDEEEKDVDDWDLDFSVYYDPHGGDKDARDFVRMTRDVRRRSGVVCTDDEMHDARIGRFEQHTKGIGRKLMQRQGWREGQGLGSRVQGIADPVDGEGQQPWDKKGLGYRGEKLLHAVHPSHPDPPLGPPPPYAPSAKRPRRVNPDLPIISTIYDDPRVTDPPEGLLRKQEPYHLKHRPYGGGGVKFNRSDTLLLPLGRPSAAATATSGPN